MLKTAVYNKKLNHKEFYNLLNYLKNKESLTHNELAFLLIADFREHQSDIENQEYFNLFKSLYTKKYKPQTLDKILKTFCSFSPNYKVLNQPNFKKEAIYQITGFNVIYDIPENILNILRSKENNLELNKIKKNKEVYNRYKEIEEELLSDK